MAKEFLHSANIRAPVQEVRGKGVAECVRGYALAEVCLGKVFPEDESDPSVCDPPASLIDKQRTYCVR
jgi:hypothetical protein